MRLDCTFSTGNSFLYNIFLDSNSDRFGVLSFHINDQKLVQIHISTKFLEDDDFKNLFFEIEYELCKVFGYLNRKKSDPEIHIDFFYEGEIYGVAPFIYDSEKSFNDAINKKFNINL